MVISAAASQKKHPASGKGYKNDMGIQISIRRVVALSLCCILVFCSAYHPAYAGEVAAASVAVQGAQLITGGLVGQQLVDKIGPQISSVVGVTLEGLGVSTYTTEQSLLKKSEYVANQIAVWAVQAHMKKEEFYETVAKGMNVARDGTIQFTKDAARLIYQFGNWLFQSGRVQDVPASGGSGDGLASFGDYQALRISLASPFTFYNSSGGLWAFTVTSMIEPVYAVICRDSLIFFSTSAQTILFDKKYNNEPPDRNRTVVLENVAGYYYYKDFFSAARSDDIPVYNVYAYNFMHSIANISPSDSVPVPTEDCFTGSPDVWAENKDLINPGSASWDESKVPTVNPDLINQIIDSLAAGNAYDMSITGYLDALQKAFDKQAENVAELTDTVTGIADSISVPTTATDSVTVTLDTSKIGQPTLDPEAIDYDGSIDGLSFDLTRIFPFCIPFDVMAACQLFDAEPQAPHFEIHETLPYNIPFDIVLDLSDFDRNASICRKLEFVLFVVGLAVVTRSLFIRA